MKRGIFSVTNKIGVGFDTGLVTIFRWTIIVASLVVVLSIFTVVFLRYIFRRGVWGTEEIALSVMMWLWMITIAYTTRQRSHVSSTFPAQNRSAQGIYRIVSSSLCLMIVLLFCYYSYNYCIWLIANDARTITFTIPRIYIFSSVFIGFVLTAGYLIWEIVDNVRAFRDLGMKQKE